MSRRFLSAGDFSPEQSVHVRFDDGSYALFRYAFALLDAAGERCMVLTEHCGYHVFPVGASGVEVTRSVPLGESPDASAADKMQPLPPRDSL